MGTLAEATDDILRPRFTQPIHVAKAEMASELSRSHNLPDIADFLSVLNSARKAAAYGDVDFPALNAQDVAIEIEQYVEAASALLADETNEQSSDEQ